MASSHDRPVRPVARINTGKRASAPLDTFLWAQVKQYAVDHDRNLHVLVDQIFSQWLEGVGYLEPSDDGDHDDGFAQELDRMVKARDAALKAGGEL